MTATYRIEPRERIVYMSISGESSFAEWRSAWLAVFSDPAFSPGMGFLNDRSSQTNIHGTTFVKDAVGFFKEQSHKLAGCRWATVSGDNDAAYGLQRMLSLRSEGTGVTVRAFRDFEEARQWLLSAGQ